MTTVTLGRERVLTITGLSDTDAARLAILARAYNARWVPALKGYALFPANAARVEALYEAGYTCAYRNGGWYFGLHGERLTKHRYDAVRLAKEVVCLR